MRDFRGLSVFSLVSASDAGATGAAGAWVLSIKVRMNSWKRLFDEATGVGAGAGTGPGAGGPMAGLPRQTGGIVAGSVEWSGERSGERRAERRAETMKKKADLPCLPNRLAKPLWELLEL